MKAWIFDSNRNSRGERLRKQLVTLRLAAEFHSQVWDENKHPTVPDWSSCSNDFQIGKDDIIFIHAQDVQQIYWRLFVRRWQGIPWVIIYSGGGIEKQRIAGEFEHSPRICIFQPAVPDDARAPWRIEAFIDCIRTKNAGCCEKLIGFDPQLEARLRLLHLCLTPEGKDAARMLFESEIRPTLLVSAPPRNRPESEAEWAQLPVANAFSTMMEVMEQERDCFSPAYLSALSELKKTLNARPKIIEPAPDNEVQNSKVTTD
jgi:hypothetical protein